MANIEPIAARLAEIEALANRVHRVFIKGVPLTFDGMEKLICDAALIAYRRNPSFKEMLIEAVTAKRDETRKQMQSALNQERPHD